SLDTYASAVQRLGRMDEALALNRECLAGRQATLGPEDSDTLTSMNNLAVLLGWRGEWAESVQLLRQVLAIRERRGKDAETFNSAGNLGNCLYGLGELDEAEKILPPYPAQPTRQFGPDGMITHFLRSSQARVWVEHGKADQAVETLDELI